MFWSTYWILGMGLVFLKKGCWLSWHKFWCICVFVRICLRNVNQFMWDNSSAEGSPCSLSQRAGSPESGNWGAASYFVICYVVAADLMFFIAQDREFVCPRLVLNLESSSLSWIWQVTCCREAGFLWHTSTAVVGSQALCFLRTATCNLRDWLPLKTFQKDGAGSFNSTIFCF